MSEKFSNLFDNTPSVWITSFWGWSPDSWGCVGFTNQQRPHNIAKLTSNPFVMLIYVTPTAPGNSPYKGKVTGFYELSHEIKDKSELIDSFQLNDPRHPQQAWKHSFKALRAWTIEKNEMPLIKNFYPEVYSKDLYRSISTWARELPKKQIKMLNALNFEEVPVYDKGKTNG